jgi:hypothetical protein
VFSFVYESVSNPLVVFGGLNDKMSNQSVSTEKRLAYIAYT